MAKGEHHRRGDIYFRDDSLKISFLNSTSCMRIFIESVNLSKITPH